MQTFKSSVFDRLKNNPSQKNIWRKECKESTKNNTTCSDKILLIDYFYYSSKKKDKIRYLKLTPKVLICKKEALSQKAYYLDLNYCQLFYIEKKIGEPPFSKIKFIIELRKHQKMCVFFTYEKSQYSSWLEALRPLMVNSDFSFRYSFTELLNKKKLENNKH